MTKKKQAARLKRQTDRIGGMYVVMVTRKDGKTNIAGSIEEPVQNGDMRLVTRGRRSLIVDKVHVIDGVIA